MTQTKMSGIYFLIRLFWKQYEMTVNLKFISVTVALLIPASFKIVKVLSSLLTLKLVLCNL